MSRWTDEERREVEQRFAAAGLLARTGHTHGFPYVECDVDGHMMRIISVNGDKAFDPAMVRKAAT
jgi:hypothetical protein